MTENLIEILANEDDSDGFQFVLRAMKDRIGPKEQVCSNNCVKIEDGKLIGTDGKRIHIYELKETYKPGIYRVLKALKTHIILGPDEEINYKKPFPNIEEAIPLFDEKVQIDEIFPDSDYGIMKGLTKVIRALELWETINPKYLKDLGGLFTCTIDKNKQMVFFEGVGQKAYITKAKFEE